jgi:hypothetical protein
VEGAAVTHRPWRHRRRCGRAARSSPAGRDRR